MTRTVSGMKYWPWWLLIWFWRCPVRSADLIVKDDVEKGAVDVQRAVVFDQAEFPEQILAMAALSLDDV